MTDDILICIAYSLKVQTLRVILNFHFLLKIESRKHGNILAVARSELSCYVFWCLTTVNIIKKHEN